MAMWLQEVLVFAIVGAAIWTLVRTFSRKQVRACPGCKPQTRRSKTGHRARGLTILP